MQHTAKRRPLAVTPTNVTQDEVEQAVRIILHWIGENPDREGLLETPARVARAYKSYFSGYEQNPEEYLSRLLMRRRDTTRWSCFETSPFRATANIIWRRSWVVPGWAMFRRPGSSAFQSVRVVEAFANRLQIQERLTAETANVIERVLQPQGVAVVLKASHHCISARGVKKHGVDLTTSRMLGCFRTDPMSRQEFLAMVNSDIRN